MRIMISLWGICLWAMSSLSAQSTMATPYGYAAEASPAQLVYRHLADQPKMAREFLVRFGQMDQVEQILQQKNDQQGRKRLAQQRAFLLQKVRAYDPAVHGQLSFRTYVGDAFLQAYPYGADAIRR